MPAVKQIELGAPEASVDIHRDWKGPLAFREPEIAELAGIAAVGETSIGRGWLQSEDVFGHADSGTDCIWTGSQILDFRLAGSASNRTQFYHRALTPTVLLTRKFLHRAKKVTIIFFTEHAGMSREILPADADSHFGVRPHILNPVRRIVLGDHVEA